MFRNTMRILITIVALQCHANTSVGNVTIVPNDAIQSRFQELIRLAVDVPFSEKVSIEYDEQCAESIALANNDSVLLARQWVYCYTYYVGAQEGRHRSHMAIAMYGVREKLKISQKDFCYALYPLLDASDETLRNVAETFIDDTIPREAAGFGVYDQIIRENFESAGDLPTGLLRYMYSGKPGVTVLLVMSLDKEIFGGLKSVFDVKIDELNWPTIYDDSIRLIDSQSPAAIATELEALSDRPEWWVQLLVAEFVTQVPEVNSETIRSNLEKSEHPLVSEVLAHPNKYKKGSTRR